MNADASVAHTHHRLLAVTRHRDLNGLAGLAVPRAVVEQVGKHLRQPRAIGMHVDRLVWCRHRQRLATERDQRHGGLDRVADGAGQVQGLGPHLHLARRDARYVQQVVDQTDHLRHLALHDLARLRGSGQVIAGELQDPEPRADRCQWIAQFVRQRREEVVLAAVGFLQGLDRPLLIGDIDAQAVRQLRPAVSVVGGLTARLHPP